MMIMYMCAAAVIAAGALPLSDWHILLVAKVQRRPHSCCVSHHRQGSSGLLNDEPCGRGSIG
jgi:hypothetical protein